MTVLLPKATRRSRFLFDWSAAACLAAPEQSLDAVTGQVATFTRAGLKATLDAAGRYRLVGHSLPGFDWQTDPVSGLRVPSAFLEAAGTNLVIQSDVVTTGGGWTVGGAVSAVNLTYAGRPFTYITNATGGNINRSVTFTGNGTKAFSFLFKADSTVTGIAHLLLYDGTTATLRGTVNVTVAAGGVVTATGSSGATVIRVEALADGVYRIHSSVAGIVAANTNYVYACDSGGTTCASYLVSGIQVENGPTPSSLIPTASGAVTRAADALTFPFNMPPRSSTWYVAFVESGTIYTGQTEGLLSVGDSVAPYLFLFNDSTNHYAMQRGDASTVATAGVGTAPTLGQRVELRGVINADGSMLIGQSINGATEVVTATTVAFAMASAWSSTVLRFNDRGVGTVTGKAGMQAVRIAAGVQTLATMRTG